MVDRGGTPLGSRISRRIGRDFLLGPPRRPARSRPETLVPGERARVERRRRVTAYVLAVTLPAATAFGLLPLRAHHAPLVALILVVPVIAVAVLGAVGPAVLAALSAGIAYDLAHTEPYWRLVIDDPDDITTTVAPAIVAVVVGVVCSQVVHLRERDAARHRELEHLLHLARAAADGADDDTLVEAVRGHLIAVLGLRECRWQPGYHGGAGPVLLPTGAVMGFITALEPDQATLPDGLEIPAVAGRQELGRFVLTPGRSAVVSAEERLTAATMVGLYARIAAGHP